MPTAKLALRPLQIARFTVLGHNGTTPCFPGRGSRLAVADCPTPFQFRGLDLEWGFGTEAKPIGTLRDSPPKSLIEGLSRGCHDPSIGIISTGADYIFSVSVLLFQLSVAELGVVTGSDAVFRSMSKAICTTTLIIILPRQIQSVISLILTYQGSGEGGGE